MTQPWLPAVLCDYTQGSWFMDAHRPKYGGKSCRFVRPIFNCDANHRPDVKYRKYSWRPRACHLDSFSASTFFKKLGSKTVAVMGDSMAKNFHEALLCLLDSGYDVKDWSGKLGGGWRRGQIVNHPWGSTKILFVGSAYLMQTTPLKNTGGRGKLTIAYTVNLSKVDPVVAKTLLHADVAILQTGHWFVAYPPGRKGSNVYLMNGKVTNVTDVQAHQFSLITLVKHLLAINYGGLPYFMSYSPTHSLPGWWPGGKCAAPYPLPARQTAQLDRLSTATAYRNAQKRTLKGTLVRLLDITHLSMFRADAHLQTFYEDPKKASNHVDDCTHWCLPGVPDIWADILQTHLMHEPQLGN
eukprot:jgi/Mesen1/9083/ME000058S08576